jgi:hypothetical protein
MKEEDRGWRIATASGGRQWGRRLEFLRLRASRHAALDGDGEEDGAELLVLLSGRGSDRDGGSTVRRWWWRSGACRKEDNEGERGMGGIWLRRKWEEGYGLREGSRSGEIKREDGVTRLAWSLQGKEGHAQRVIGGRRR